MKWLREIYCVGFKDWCWFVIYLRRNEFSRKLDVDCMSRRMELRMRAHAIDILLEDINEIHRKARKA
jgi:hypothetical protein